MIDENLPTTPSRTTESTTSAKHPLLVVLQKERTVYVLIGLYTLSAILFGLLFRPIGDANIEMDFYGCYAPEANAILNGALPIDDWRGPVFPILVALMKLVSGDFFKGGMMLAGLASGAVLFCSYRIFRKLANHNIAGLVLVAIAVNANFIKYSYSAATDMVFVALCFAALALLLNCEKLTLRHAILAGLFSGAAYLTRYNGIVLLAVFVVLVFVRRPTASTVWEKYRPLIGFVAAMALLVVPWGLYCLSNRGAFFYNRGYFNIAYEIFGKSQTEPTEFLRLGGQGFLSYTDVLFADPLHFITSILKNIFTHFFHDLGLSNTPTVSHQYPRALNQLLSVPFGILTICGLISLFRNKPHRAEAILLATALAYFLFMTVVSSFPRYSLFLLPVYCYLSLRWLLQMGWFQNKFLHFPLGSIILSIAIVLTAWESALAVKFDQSKLPTGFLTLSPTVMGERHTFTTSDRIASWKPHAAYMLGGTWVPLGYVTSFGDLLVQLNKNDVDYLFFGSFEAVTMPQVAPLIQGKYATHDLIPMTVSHHPDAAIYKFSHRLDGLVLERLHFDPQLVGTLEMKPVYLDNNERVPLRIDSVKGQNRVFQYTSIQKPIIVDPNLSAFFAIRFRPLVVGDFSDTIWVYHSGNLSPGLIICDGSAEEP